MKKRIFTTTKDGSNTLYIPELDEHYHSTNGAIQEAEIVYIKAALNFCDKKEINILEVGFGTGLNAFLTMTSCAKKIKYTSLELYPLTADEYSMVNHYDFIDGVTKDDFLKLHQCPWDEFCYINENFALRKLNEDLRLLSLDNGYDVVYFDAFAPDIQADLWTEDIFKKIFDSMNHGGVLTTYCVKGIVKRALKACGFKIEKLPGALGKREMLRAIKE